MPVQSTSKVSDDPPKFKIESKIILITIFKKKQFNILNCIVYKYISYSDGAPNAKSLTVTYQVMN